MLFKISIKYYITIIFSLFSFVKRYAVRNVKIRQYAVHRVKIRQYAVRKGEGGVSPSQHPTLFNIKPVRKRYVTVTNPKIKLEITQ